MSPVPFSTNWDQEASLANLRDNAIGTWAAAHDTRDILLYLVGTGRKENFQLNDTEILSAKDLDDWLDDLQGNIPVTVTVIYDADYSGSFLPLLDPPEDKERILISSTSGDQAALFLSQGVISFSSFFWKGVWNGLNVRDAFLNARNAISFFSSDTGMPILNDTGNDNGSSNGQLAMSYTVGAGIKLAGDDPLVGTVSPDKKLNGKTSATIWVENVTAINMIEKVWAVITPPDFIDPVSALPTLVLNDAGDGRYEGTYKNFFASGIYKVAVYAMDTGGNISLCKKTLVHQQDGLGTYPDIYEDDDNPEQACLIIVNDETPQHHNFYDAEDEDWVKFHGTSGNIYTIEVRNLEKNCDVVLELYDSNQELLSSKNTPLIPHVDEQLHWQCPEDGIYYLRVRNDLNVFGECTAYFLKIYSPIGPSGVNFKIKVMDILSRVPVENAQVEIIGYGHGIDLGNGEYLLNCEGDNPIKIIEINASGYMTESDEISVAMDDEMKLVKELKLKPFHSADYNPSDNKISLSEMLRVIQLYNKGAYHCDPQGEDRYGAGSGDQTCPPHHSDYNPKDWRINLSELLRLVQFYNASGYHVDLSGEDSFCAGMR